MHDDDPVYDGDVLCFYFYVHGLSIGEKVEKLESFFCIFSKKKNNKQYDNVFICCVLI